ncbi:MAG: DNA polymerase I [Oscillospiraceae bacterium]|jgi:DNA polymerase-1|nr:DNA polymerase I [Oscillospiraceae bacterium]
MKLLAIDGNSLINRAFYGIKPLCNSKGIFTNAIMGFIKTQQRAFANIKPDCVAVAFDLRAPTFRHKAVDTYKATRKPMKEELAMQFPYIKEILKAMGITCVECKGYEADDILGTLAVACDKTGNECVVLTGDRDSFQLITDNVNILYAGNTNQILFNKEIFIDDYGFNPINLIDYKALAGDSSDNISGVMGIGDVTAKKLIKQFETIENLYEHIDDCGLKGATLQKLKDGFESAKQSKWLATICTDVPIERDISSYRISNPDVKRLSIILTDLEMFKTLDSLRLKPIKAKTDIQPTLFDTPETEEKQETEVIELTDLSILGNNNLYYLFENNSIFISFNGKKYKTEKLNEFFSLSNEKFTFGGKNQYHYCLKNNIPFKIDFDIEIAAYLLNPNSKEYNIKQLCGIERIDYTDDVLCLEKLCEKLKKRIEENNLTQLMYDIELPLTEVLASMEVYGVGVDRRGIEKFGQMLTERIEGITEQIYFMAGKQFNIGSPKQLQEVLFDDLLLPVGKKTKTGYSTNAEVLEELIDKHPIIELILDYRQCTKLNSTYVEGLLKTIADDERIHTSFQQTETRTGRISSTEPNLQNIPVRTKLGREMRKFFVAEKGKILVDADYSQIELRILAHLSNDKNMQDAFINNEDIHTRTASQVFGCPEEMVTKDMRSAAKAVNFGIIYGMGAFSLSKEIGVSVPEAKRYITKYFAKFPDVERYINELLENAANDGYVTTMFGRKREVPELSLTKKNLRAAGERIARNTPIQGSAADIIKIAMVKVYNRLKKENINAKLILQVHDELIIETDKENSKKIQELLIEEMSNAYKLNIPLYVEAHCGKNWYDAKD